MSEDFVNGYAYAINSASAAVLSMLQTRCAKAAGNKLAALAKCKYTVNPVVTLG